MSFYNTYRPKTFEEIDNEQVRTLVTSLLSKKKENLPHAFFLTGPRGIGKTTAARIIAKLFNCLNPNKSGEPCGTCELCIRIGQGNAMDVMEIDAASNTGVDNIRDLKDKIMLAPVQAKWKIYIIDEVHMLSTGAFNALLKTLEEPPAHTVFILATTDPQKVPETIQSRCVLLQFKKPELNEIIAALKRIVAAEKITIDDAALTLLAEAADGSFRDATKLLEQATLASKEITAVTLQQMLSLPEDELVFTFIELIRTKDAAGLITTIESFSKNGVDVRQFYTSLLKKLQKQLVMQITGKTSPVWDIHELQTSTGILLQTYGTIRGSVLPELALELAVLSYCTQQNQPTTHTIAPKPPVTQTHIAPVQNKPAITQMVPKPAAVVPAPVVQQTTPTADVNPTPPVESTPAPAESGKPFISENFGLDTLVQHWADIIVEVRQFNHSISGVLRSTRPKSAINGIVTIEAFYPFHKDKLSEIKARDAMSATIKKLFGETVSIEVVLGKK